MINASFIFVEVGVLGTAACDAIHWSLAACELHWLSWPPSLA